MSAPEKPTVWAATRSRSTSAAKGVRLVCTSRMARRAASCGKSSVTLRSNRPGLSNAGSSTSGRLVAANTTTGSPGSKPSISERIWFRVCSRSSLPPPSPVPRARPTESISSMNTSAGASARACLNISRTRDAPTPTNISMNSEPLMLKNGTSASPATAFASSVLPVPGGPIIRIPRGILAPSASNFSGSRR